MGNSEVQYQEQRVKIYPRSLGHKIRCTLALIGIWFWFLMVVLIPIAKHLDATERNNSESRDTLVLTAVGAGLLQGAAFFFLPLTMIGVRKTGVHKMLGYVLLAIYIVGLILLLVGRGRQTEDTFDGTEKWQDNDEKMAVRTRSVGVLIGEGIYCTLGLLILLPDFGFLE
eukprot:Sspe_Gene.4847::Locus_1603_Transcript_1_1_Confidence_1.000_Length_665::g.4847::m.4847